MAPPLVGVAVKVTAVPAQIVVAVAAILMLTGKFGLTVIVIPGLVAGLLVVQIALEVNTTVTICPFVNVVVVNVLLLVPAFTPLIFHW